MNLGLRHILETEVSIWSRRYNAYFLKNGSAEVTTSRRSAIEALEGDFDGQRRERAINRLFHFVRGEQNHCRNVLIDDEQDACELKEVTQNLRDHGLL